MSEEKLPNGWHRVRMDSLGALHCGQSPPSAAVNREGRGTPYVTGPEQWDGTRVHLDKWTTEPKRLAPARSVFVTVKGAGVGTLFPGVAAAIGRDVYAFEPTSDVDAGFVLYALRHSIEALKAQAVGDIPGLSRSDILDHEVVKPALDEQRRIVAKLDALRARSRRAKDALDAVPPLLDRLRQSILAAAFRGDLTADWREQNPNVEPASDLLKRIRVERRKRWEEAELAKLLAKGKPPEHDRWKARYDEPALVDDAALPELPDGWCWASVEELCVDRLRTGLSMRGSDEPPGLPTLRLDALRGEFVDVSRVRFSPVAPDEVGDVLVRDGDFLVSRGNGSLRLLARGSLAAGIEGDLMFPDTAFRLRFHRAVVAWARNLWAAPQIRAQVEARAKTTAGIYKVAQSDLATIAIPVPPIAEMTNGARLVRSALGAVQRLDEGETGLRTSITSFDAAILAAAFRGELLDRQSDDASSVNQVGP